MVGVCLVACRGAAVRAGNEINSAGAASLAPSLSQMTQLKSLNLRGTLRVSRAAALGAGAWERRQCVDDVACCGPGRLRAGLWRVVGVCEKAGRGAAVCADNQIGDDGAASLAPSLEKMAQLTSLHLYGTRRASAGLVL